MAQQVRAFATMPAELSSIPRKHVVEGENQLLSVVSDLHMHALAHMHPHSTRVHAHTHACTIIKPLLYDK